jgi:hypothetical protein
VEIEPNELTPEFVGDKSSRLDVVAKTEDGQILNVEIQVVTRGTLSQGHYSTGLNYSLDN